MFLLCSAGDALCNGLCFRCSFPLSCHPQFQILRKLSQEPVATAMPSAVTPRQLTLLSWPERIPDRRGRRKISRRNGAGRGEGLDRAHHRPCTYCPVSHCLSLHNMTNKTNMQKNICAWHTALGSHQRTMFWGQLAESSQERLLLRTSP